MMSKFPQLCTVCSCIAAPPLSKKRHQKASETTPTPQPWFQGLGSKVSTPGTKAGFKVGTPRVYHHADCRPCPVPVVLSQACFARPASDTTAPPKSICMGPLFGPGERSAPLGPTEAPNAPFLLLMLDKGHSSTPDAARHRRGCGHHSYPVNSCVLLPLARKLPVL